MLRIFFLFIVLSISGAVLAQSQVIKGTVVDYATGDPLVGATIKHVSSGKEALTDFDGNFEIPVEEPGVNKIIISYVSYEKTKLNRIMVKDEHSVEIKIKMRKVGNQNHESSIIGSKDNVQLT